MMILAGMAVIQISKKSRLFLSDCFSLPERAIGRFRALRDLPLDANTDPILLIFPIPDDLLHLFLLQLDHLPHLYHLFLLIPSALIQRQSDELDEGVDAVIGR